MDQLIGAQAGDKRTVHVEFPADFLVKELAGKQGAYEVELLEVKERLLPPLDDAFANLLEAADLQTLRAGVRRDLEREQEYRKNQHIRQQVVQVLLAKTDFELPETAIKTETRHVVYDIVNDSRRRGATSEQIEKSKEEIYSVAFRNARERVKAAFIFRQIAEKENLKISEEELRDQLFALAQQQKMSADKFVKELEKTAIIRALSHFEGNRRQAAQALGIGNRTLYRKLKEYDIE